jgi:hypothetical protein
MQELKFNQTSTIQELSFEQLEDVNGGGKYRLGAAAGFAVGGVFGAAIAVGGIAAVSYFVAR